MSHQDQLVRVGVDIGGTFTDVVLETGDQLITTKRLTDHAEPDKAVLEGIGHVVDKVGLHAGDIDSMIHGTTLATNALIERQGAKTAFITTEGFRDVIEMRNEGRFEQYDLNIRLPAPLVSREHRYVVQGRLAATGRELVPLDESAVHNIVDRIIEGRYESVAVGLIHAYVNADHEQRIRQIIRQRVPDIAISISSEVSPQMREYERFNTVCVNAFVKPLVAVYLKRLRDRLKGIGVTAPLFMIHSGGGLISVDSAIAFPVRLLESGPAGGAIFAADIAARHGLEKVLSYDMGGTTAKICLIEDRLPKTARVFEAARTYRFKKGSGMPISIPVIEMIEIGAGGGSIGWVDSMRQIRVGPKSAGAEPGPACYNRGGVWPTVSDADLLLGRLDKDHFAGGRIPLLIEQAIKALDEEIGGRLKMDTQTAAVGLCEVVDENMANAARVHAVESGKDLSEFTLIAFGGAAPLHVSRLGEKLGIQAVLVPPAAGVGSAVGFLKAPFGFEAVRGAYLKLSEFSARWVNDLVTELRDEARQFATAGPAHEVRHYEIKAYMRYAGQGWDISVALPNRPYVESDKAEIRRRFEAEYRRLFGRALSGLDIEMIQWSVLARSGLTRPDIVARVAPRRLAKPVGQRRMYDPHQGDFVDAWLYDRAALRSGDRVPGPAIIVEDETTTVITMAFQATMQADHCLLLERRSGESTGG